MSSAPEFPQRGRGRGGLDAASGQGREAQSHAQFSGDSLVSAGDSLRWISQRFFLCSVCTARPDSGSEILHPRIWLSQLPKLPSSAEMPADGHLEWRFCGTAGFGQPWRVPMCSAEPGSKVDTQNQPWLEGSLELSISCSALGISAVSAGPCSTGQPQPLLSSYKANRLGIGLLKIFSAQLLEFDSFP